MYRKAVLLALLVAFAAAFGSVSFPGIIYTGSKTIAADSVRFAISSGLRFFETSGWGGGPERYDTMMFTLEEMPTFFGLYYRMNGEACEPLMAVFTPDSWYYLPVTGNPPPHFPQLKWGRSGAVEEVEGVAVAERGLTATPNPFSARTSLSFTLAAAGPVRLEVYDRLGRQVRSLVAGRLEAGTHVATWDGLDGEGSRLKAGVYLVRLTALGQTGAGRLVLTN